MYLNDKWARKCFEMCPENSLVQQPCNIILKYLLYRSPNFIDKNIQSFNCSFTKLDVKIFCLSTLFPPRSILIPDLPSPDIFTSYPINEGLIMRKQSPNESLGDCCVSGRTSNREFYLNEPCFMMICKNCSFLQWSLVKCDRQRSKEGGIF